MCETLLDDSAVSVNAIFNHVNVMFLLMPFSGMAITVLALSGFKEKIMLYCFREVRCQQSYTPRI